jgi:hypothetical protein
MWGAPPARSWYASQDCVLSGPPKNPRNPPYLYSIRKYVEMKESIRKQHWTASVSATDSMPPTVSQA